MRACVPWALHPDIVMDFRHGELKDSALLPRRSLLVMAGSCRAPVRPSSPSFLPPRPSFLSLIWSAFFRRRIAGPARYLWKHGIAKRKTDVVDGGVRRRERRLSLTLRWVCTLQCAPCTVDFG